MTNQDPKGVEQILAAIKAQTEAFAEKQEQTRREFNDELRTIREEGRRRGDKQDRLETQVRDMGIALGTVTQQVKEHDRRLEDLAEASRRRDSGFARSTRQLSDTDQKQSADIAAVIVAVEGANARIGDVERTLHDIRGESKPDTAAPTLVTVAQQNEQGIDIAQQGISIAQKSRRVSLWQVALAVITLLTSLAGLASKYLDSPHPAPVVLPMSK